MRKDGRKEAGLSVGYDENGKQIIKHFYGKTITEARRKRDEYKQKLNEGINNSGDITLNEWISRFCDVYKPKDMDYLINRLSRSLGTRKLQSITEMDLQRELNTIAGMSTSHISKYMQIIKRIFLRARTNRLIVFDPAENLIAPKGTKGTHRALEKWEINAIMEYWRIYPAGRWAMAMLLCGLRRSEMIALQWADINMDNRTLLVHASANIRKNQPVIQDKTKSRAGMRLLPICGQLYDMLSETPVAQRSGFVFRTTKNAPITESAARRNWITFCQRLTRQLNGERVHPARGSNNDAPGRIVFNCRMHDLRHTFATMLYDAGVDAKAAQYYLGHSDIKITLDLYTHLSHEREQIERANLVGFLDGYMGKNLNYSSNIRQV